MLTGEHGMFEQDRGWGDWSAVRGRAWWKSKEMSSERKPGSQNIVPGETFGWEAIAGHGCHIIRFMFYLAQKVPGVTS